ncbi:MAG: hypothetical protein IPN22_07145 [Bacteroidetes bacterium]|nr:hypothetical protein [Bacteroidota bacterium]
MWISTDADGIDNLWRTVDDGLRVMVCSPAVDRGESTFAPLQDVLGNIRYDAQNLGSSITDIGAYENTYDGPDMTLTIQGDTLSTLLKASSYTWVVCPGLTPAPGISNSYEYVAITGGSYALLLSDGQCAFTSDCVNAGPSSAVSTHEIPSVSVFPNPSYGTFTLQSENAGQWLIWNSMGQRIQELTGCIKQLPCKHHPVCKRRFLHN